MIRRTLAVALKEFVQLRRDWRTSLALLGMPMVLLLIYGFALSFDVRHVRLAVIDLDASRAAREVEQAFVHSGFFDLVQRGTDSRDIDALMDSGRAQAALVVPAGYAAALTTGRPGRVQLVLDGSDSQMATTVLAYARQIVATVAPHRERTAAAPPARPLVWYNPDLASARFLLPGLVAFILMVTTVIATALAVVREKERGSWESLRATPLGALELLVGKTFPYLVLAAVAAAGSLALAWGLFQVPLRGSLLWLALVTLLFLLGGLGWGVLISTLADSQQVAFQVALFSTMLPTLLLSGFIFPISSMPAAVQAITHIVPARYYLVALRGIVLKGSGPAVWGGEMLALGVFAAAVLGIAAARTVRTL